MLDRLHSLSLKSKASLLTGAAVCLSLVIQGGIIAGVSQRYIEKESLARANAPLQEAAVLLEKHFLEVQNNVRVLAELSTVQRVLKENSIESYRDVAEVFQLVAKNHPSYSQIRLIGVRSGGREVVRVNRNADTVALVEQVLLQEKGHRDYFRKTMQLKKGEVFISPFELNRENKVIVEPFQPVIRYSMPVYDSDGFAKLGFVIINVDSEPLFDQIKTLFSAGAEFFVSNDQGQFLYHPNKALEYAFEFGRESNIQRQFQKTKSLLWGVETKTEFLTKGVLSGGEHAAAFRRARFGQGQYYRDIVFGVSQPVSSVFVGGAGFWFIVASIVLVLSMISIFVIHGITARLLRPLLKMSALLAEHKNIDKPVNLPIESNDETGELAEAINGMQHHIKEQFLQLSQQKNILDSVIQSAVDAIVQIDEKGVIESWNFAAEKMFGYGFDEVVGKNIRLLMADEQAKEHDAHLENYTRTGESTTIGIGREAIARKKNGMLFPVHLSVGEFEVDGRRKFTGVIYDASKQRAFEDSLRRLACSDGLTGALNQRAFTERGIVEAGRAHRQKKEMCLLLIDIDYFKDLNDAYGHKAGDAALRFFVREARITLRSHDIIGRIGGDEFAILCPDTSIEEALQVATRIRRSVVLKPVSNKFERMRFTISVGIAQINLKHGEGYDALFARADHMLYAAKEKGRNCIVEQKNIAVDGAA